MQQTILACNTHLSSEEFTQRTSKLLAPRMDYLSSLRGYEYVKQTIADVSSFAHRNDIDGIGIPYSWIADGILWSYTSLRLPQDTEMKLESLSIDELVTLIHTCSEQCSTYNDVMHYLAENVYTTRD